MKEDKTMAKGTNTIQRKPSAPTGQLTRPSGGMTPVVKPPITNATPYRGPRPLPSTASLNKPTATLSKPISPNATGGGSVSALLPGMNVNAGRKPAAAGGGKMKPRRK
jgi:hypothetical protein